MPIQLQRVMDSSSWHLPGTLLYLGNISVSTRVSEESPWSNFLADDFKTTGGKNSELEWSEVSKLNNTFVVLQTNTVNSYWNYWLSLTLKQSTVKMNRLKRGGFSCLKDRMLEKFQPIKIAMRFYWLNAFLTKSKSIVAENVLNQWKIIKNIKICGLQPQYYSDNHQD